MAVVSEWGGQAQQAEPVGEAAVIDVRGLQMRYGTLNVLDGVDFRAARGEVLALLGPNGAGKTTTIEILEGFRIRSGGAVSVLGVDPAQAGEHWRASASCCSPGGTTASGGCTSCWPTWAATTRRTRPRNARARGTWTN